MGRRENQVSEKGLKESDGEGEGGGMRWAGLEGDEHLTPEVTRAKTSGPNP